MTKQKIKEKEPTEHPITKELTEWTKAKNYIGKDFSNYYVFDTHHDRAGIISEVNFEIEKERLEEFEGVKVRSFSHWSTSGLQQILIHKSASWDVFDIVEDIEYQKQKYPILDEEKYFKREKEKIIKCLEYLLDVDKEAAEYVYYNISHIEYDRHGAIYDEEEAKELVKEYKQKGDKNE